MFAIEIRNTGNVSLRNISISDPLAPDCDRTISSLAAGNRSSYSCGAPNVEMEFTNSVTVRARDSEGTRVSDSDTAEVEVENPNIQIVISPPRQTVLRGDTARFSIFVVNTSRTVSLTDVEVVDPLVPNCSREIGNLPKGEERIYSCEKKDVTEPFTNQISVSARNIFSGEEVQDSTSSLIAILDMEVKLSVKPSVVPILGGPVQFVVDILNDGSVPFEIDTLTVNPLGNVVDPSNRALKNNSCLQAKEAAVAVGQRYSCSFMAAVEGNLGPRSYLLQARAKDADGKRISASDERIVFVANDNEFITKIDAVPASLPAPGGEVSESIFITNDAPSGDVNLTFLHHSTLGNLDQIGSCLLPQRIAVGDTYGCDFNLTVSGPIGTAVEHTISAAGTDMNGDYVGDNDSAAIVLFDPSRQSTWLPLVARSEEHPEEDNDTACAAFPLISGQKYDFAVDDRFDWYFFDVKRQGTVQIKIRDLDVADAQVQVFAASECQKLKQNDLVGYNGDDLPDKSLTFSANPGRHYLWVATASNPPAPKAYSMVIFTP